MLSHSIKAFCNNYKLILKLDKDKSKSQSHSLLRILVFTEEFAFYNCFLKRLSLEYRMIYISV